MRGQQSTKFHTLALDIGGVFFLGKAGGDFFERWAAHVNMDAPTLRRLLWFGPDIEQANIGEISAETYFARTATRLNVDTEFVRAIIEDAYTGELNAELIAYVRKIKPMIRVTALTNNWSFGRQLIERNGFVDLFELIINSAEVGVKKPNTGIYQALLDQLNVHSHHDPGGIIFVDDVEENLEAAQAFGIHTVHFQQTAQTIAEIAQLIGCPSQFGDF